MDSHKGMRASGRLYGFLSEFATVADEDCVVADEDCAIADEDSAAFSVDELLTAGVICNSLDEDVITHIETSEELDSGTYRSI